MHAWPAWLLVAALNTSPAVPWHAAIQHTRECKTSRADSIILSSDTEEPDTPPFPYTREAAFAVLLNTCEFVRALGPDQVPSVQAQLVNVLWHQPDSSAVFEDLYQRANLAGKLHALVGLYAVDRNLFKRHAAELRGDDPVRTQNGCANMPVAVSTIMPDIEAGTVTAEFQWVGKYMTWLSGPDK
jgi:hypothetical protein